WKRDSRGLGEKQLQGIDRNAGILAAFLRAYGKSWRVMEELPEELEEIRKQSPSKSLIFAFWHNRMLLLAYTHRDRAIQVLSSSSRDGRLMSSILGKMGMQKVLGSSSQGGAAGLRQMARQCRRGNDAALSVDGPRGPRGRLKGGVISLAALSGSPILPLAASASRVHTLSTWDRTLLPLPFAKVRLAYGNPVWVPRNSDDLAREEIRRKLEEEVQLLTDRLDLSFGHETIPPEESE
ncbi:MAG: lysophospholipid acyltransferase family protein, partial [Candidatus Krumholzibacteria bacterium]|nr:lysophospholipid acyltransferase family protein [Candidatus Krumholzibacteria bacterium]